MKTKSTRSVELSISFAGLKLLTFIAYQHFTRFCILDFMLYIFVLLHLSFILLVGNYYQGSESYSRSNTSMVNVFLYHKGTV